MTTLTHRINQLDWARIATDLDDEGYALLPGLLSRAQVQTLANPLSDQISEPLNRQINDLARHHILLTPCAPGGSRLCFFNDPMPEVLAILRKQLYHHLAPIASRWNNILGHGHHYPDTLAHFLQSNSNADQNKQLSHLHRLQESEYIALHQRNNGKLVFPFQAALLLSDPQRDFHGGELVMTEQRPRMQSRPIVLSLRQGDVVIMSTGHRPFKGSKGFYRVNMKHGVSRVRSGQRIGLALFFHHAPDNDHGQLHIQGTRLDGDLS